MTIAPTLTITHLRSRAPAREPVIARLALEALAGEVAQALPALPPQSLLVMRRLALAVTGLNLAHLPDTMQRADAARNAHGLLSDALAHAARPAHGPVPEQAPAVLFGDPAELLACIARDGLAGRLDRWWWRALLGNNFPDWRMAWHERVEAAPAALRLLARAALEASVLKALSTGVGALDTNEAAAPVEVQIETPTGQNRPETARPAENLRAAPPLQQIVTAPARAAAVLISEPDDQPAKPRPRILDRPRIVEPLESRECAQHPAPQATGTDAEAPHMGAGNTDDRQPLTSDAAAQRGEPDSLSAAPRSAQPEVTIAAQSSSQSTTPVAYGVEAATPPVAQIVKLPPQEAPARVGNVQNAPTEPIGHLFRPPAPAQLPAQIARLRTTRAPAGAPEPNTTPAPRRLSVSDLALAEATHEAKDAPATTWPLDATPLAIRSRHARLFFLVNLLLGDGLYPDFTKPAEPGFPVPIWRLLALLGTQLAGSALRADPLWVLLNRLADELPLGADCNFELDWPLSGVPEHCHPLALRHARRHGFVHWLARYHRSLRNRLAPALGLSPALVGRSIVQREGDALLWVSEAEIVVVQALEVHPVEWRLAGLDRDPGYLPSAGRTLRFVFE